MKQSVLIAIPCYGGIMSARTAIGLMNLGKELQNKMIKHDVLIVTNQSLIPKARSDMANYFLNATTFDYLHWIDADIGFSPSDFFKLYDMDVEHSMGTYRHKVQNVKYSFTLDAPNNKMIWKNDAVKVLRNVGGYSLIHRSVFETIRKKHPELKYIPYSDGRMVSDAEINNSYHFYDTPIHEGYMIPEDFAFHDKCKKCNIDMWMRPDIKLIHNGNTDFQNDDLLTTLKEMDNER